MIGKRPRGFYCTREERAVIGARAAAAGLSVSRLVLDLVHDDMADGPVSGLTATEMTELLDGLRVVVAYVRGLPDRAEDASTLQPPGSGGGRRDDGEATDRSGPSSSERVRLSISATDDEWAAVHERALRRGLSRSRYLVGLLLPDAGLNTAPLPALSGVEQREVLEALRRMPSLLSEAGAPDRLSILADAEGPVLAEGGREEGPAAHPSAKGGSGGYTNGSWRALSQLRKIRYTVLSPRLKSIDGPSAGLHSSKPKDSSCSLRSWVLALTVSTTSSG